MLDKRRKTYNKIGQKKKKLGREKDRRGDFEVAKLRLFPSFFVATQRRNTGETEEEEVRHTGLGHDRGRRKGPVPCTESRLAFRPAVPAQLA